MWLPVSVAFGVSSGKILQEEQLWQYLNSSDFIRNLNLDCEAGRITSLPIPESLKNVRMDNWEEEKKKKNKNYNNKYFYEHIESSKQVRYYKM